MPTGTGKEGVDIIRPNFSRASGSHSLSLCSLLPLPTKFRLFRQLEYAQMGLNVPFTPHQYALVNLCPY